MTRLKIIVKESNEVLHRKYQPTQVFLSINNHCTVHVGRYMDRRSISNLTGQVCLCM